MTENGPRTAELERRFNERGIELEKRLTDMESQLRTIRAVFGVAGSIITGLVVAIGIHVLF